MYFLQNEVMILLIFMKSNPVFDIISWSSFFFSSKLMHLDSVIASFHCWWQGPPFAHWIKIPFACMRDSEETTQHVI